jgi:hypothetical protein
MIRDIESIGNADFQVDPEERIRVYVGDSMTEEDRLNAVHVAKSFKDTMRPMASTAVLIPVAAHQDSDLLFHTLGQYANQRGHGPFTMFLLLNAPADIASVESTDLAEAEVDRAIAAYPELDVRSATIQYENPTIGRIRRDLWNAAMLLAYEEGRFASGGREVIGVNNDIDAVRVSPHYISRIQKHYNYFSHLQEQYDSCRMPILSPASTRVSHAVAPTHPNVGMVTRWVDNTYFQLAGHGAYEAGVVVPFGHYVYSEGFQPEATSFETAWVTGGYPGYSIPGAQLYTSPRRFIDKLPENETTQIWLEGTFGANDRCRNTLPPDISRERAEDLILSRLDDDLGFWLDVPTQDFEFGVSLMSSDNTQAMRDLEEIYRRSVERQLSKAERLMRVLVGSDVLANIVRDGFDIDACVRRQVERSANLAG